MVSLVGGMAQWKVSFGVLRNTWTLDPGIPVTGLKGIMSWLLLTMIFESAELQIVSVSITC
jgi:hypothetical protein